MYNILTFKNCRRVVRKSLWDIPSRWEASRLLKNPLECLFGPEPERRTVQSVQEPWYLLWGRHWGLRDGHDRQGSLPCAVDILLGMPGTLAAWAQYRFLGPSLKDADPTGLSKPWGPGSFQSAPHNSLPFSPWNFLRYSRNTIFCKFQVYNTDIHNF